MEFCIFCNAKVSTFLCIKAVNIFLRILVFRVTLESQHILHFIFPVILRYTIVIALFSFQIMFLITFQRFWNEGMRDFANQSRENMTINSNTWHFYFQCAIGWLISPLFNLDPRIALAAVHSHCRESCDIPPGGLRSTCTRVHVCSVMSGSLWPHGLLPSRLPCPQDFPAQEYLPGQGLNTSSPSALKLKWGNFLHRGWQSPRMPSDSGDEFSGWNSIGCLFLLPAQGKSYWPGQKVHSVFHLTEKPEHTFWPTQYDL